MTHILARAQTQNRRACRDAYDALAEEVHRIHVTWTLWRRLFRKREADYASGAEWIAAGHEAYRVTGATSEMVFLYVRWHLLNGAVSDLARLLDSKTTSGQANLTLERVLESTDFSRSPRSETSARGYLDRIAKLSAQHDLKNLRHKVLAHNDLNVALGTAATPDVDIEAFDDIVRALLEFAHALKAARDGNPLDISSPTSHADRSVERAWNTECDRLVATLARGLAGEQAV